MKRSKLLPCFVLILYAAILSVAMPVQALDACRALVRLSDLNLSLRSGVREAAAGKVPAHCRVVGVINGNIEFELRLPNDWNKRLLMLGTGGFSGYIANTTRHLDEGFAVVSTDTGHKGGSGDFFGNTKVSIDYYHRAVHLTTMVAKDIVQAYYGRKQKAAYFKGCSNGGRQALLEALWYPDDFDGIVAGAPGIELTRAQYWIIWAQQALAQNPIPLEKLALIDAASRKACDGLDGVVDGIINNPLNCTDALFSPNDLICKTEQNPKTCLTAAEADTLTKLYQGPVLPDGKRLTFGLAKGAENAGDWKVWLFEAPDGGPPLNTTMGVVGLRRLMNNPDYQISDFDLNKDHHLIIARAELGDVLETDLSDFKRKGGKLLMYQGWNDAIVRPLVTLKYYEQVVDTVKGAEDFIRLFMMPGVTHCRRGPGPDEADFLTTLVNWVEDGRKPERIEARKRSSEGVVSRTRPLCAYPKQASYKGEGSIDLADSFQCVEP